MHAITPVDNTAQRGDVAKCFVEHYRDVKSGAYKRYDN